jgi:hypothetical protein
VNDVIAVCARCGAEGPAESAEFTYSRQYEEWTCTYITECEERLSEQAQAGDHPDGF